MMAHGADPDAVDQETFTDICVMYIDGMIGNRAVVDVLSTLTAGVFNVLRAQNQRTFTQQDIIPSVYEYFEPPLSEDEKAARISETLLRFMSSSPDAPEVIRNAAYGDAR